MKSEFDENEIKRMTEEYKKHINQRTLSSIHHISDLATFNNISPEMTYNGMMIRNLSDETFHIYDGSNWNQINEPETYFKDEEKKILRIKKINRLLDEEQMDRRICENTSHI